MKKLIIIAGILAAVAAEHLVFAQARVVDISARRFEFTPNTIHLKKGEPVTIRLTSTDHSHGLLIKALKVDLDASEGQPDWVTITPAEAGTFPAICDDYCGSGHGDMKMTVIVDE